MQERRGEQKNTQAKLAQQALARSRLFWVVGGGGTY